MISTQVWLRKKKKSLRNKYYVLGIYLRKSLLQDWLGREGDWVRKIFLEKVTFSPASWMMSRSCIQPFFFQFFLNFILFNFTILYWFCHISKWIRHRYTCVPHPEPSSLLPPHTIPLSCPFAPAPKHPVSRMEPGLATRFIYDIIHISMPFSQIISPSPSPTESKRLFYTSVSLLLSHIQDYCYHLSKFHIYALVYCIGVFLSGLLHSV